MAVNPIQLFTHLPGQGGGYGEAEPDSAELRRLLAQLLARDDGVIKHPLQGAANLADTAFKGLAYQQAKAREQGNVNQAAELYAKLFGGGAQKPNVLGPGQPPPPPSALRPSDPSPETPSPPQGAMPNLPPHQGFEMGPSPLDMNAVLGGPKNDIPPQIGDPAAALGIGALNAPPPAPMPAPAAPVPAAPPVPQINAAPAMPGAGGAPMPMGGGAPPVPPPVQFAPPEPVGSVQSAPPPVSPPPLQMQAPNWAKQGPQGGMQQAGLRSALAAALAKGGASMPPMSPAAVPTGADPSTMAGFDGPTPMRMPQVGMPVPPPEPTAAVGPPTALQAVGAPPPLVSPAREQIAEVLANMQPQRVASLGPMDSATALPPSESITAREPGSIVGPDLAMPTKAPSIQRAAIAAALEGDFPDFRGRGGPASIRYNNPGAQYPGPSARRFGSIGTETIGGGHKIAVFPDAVSGAAAQFDLFANRYTGMPLERAINRWSGGNSPSQYMRVIQRETGLSPDTVLTRQHLADPKIGIPLAKAMSVQEAGRPYPMSDAAWQAAHNKAFGNAPQIAAAPEQPRASYDLPQAPVHVADSSGGMPQISRDELIQMYKNPYTRPFAMQYGIKQMEEQYKRSRPPTEAERLDMDYKRSQIGKTQAETEKLRRGEAPSEMDRVKLERERMALEKDRRALSPAEDPNTAGNIAAGINRLATIPNEFDPFTLDQSIGALQGDDQGGIATSIARAFGSARNAFKGQSTTEVRSRIRGDTEALAASIKPLIRKPGEGTWTDADQARLVSIVGNLATANDADEYRRALDGVRSRIRANFNIDLPPIDFSGFSIRRLP